MIKDKHKKGAILLIISVCMFLCSCAPKGRPGKEIRFAGRTCDNCHQKEIDTFLARNVVHDPIKKIDCKACHEPHGVLGVLHLWEGVEARVCYTCHKEEEELSYKHYQHSVFKEGKCSPCHNPHSSDMSKLLKEPGNDLCYSCHDREPFQRTFVHKPLQETGCLSCHAPHASDYQDQLSSSPDEVCLNCHPMNQGLIESHKGYEIKGEHCLMCHDPHSSNEKGC